MYLRSLNQDASSSSGQAFFSGFMPPLGGIGPVETLSWYTVDPLWDPLAPQSNLCPRSDNVRNDLMASAAYKQHVSEAVQPLLAQVAQVAELPMGLLSLNLLQECLWSTVCQNGHTPLNASLQNQVLYENLYLQQFLYQDVEYRKLVAGNLAKEVASNLIPLAPNVSVPVGLKQLRDHLLQQAPQSSSGPRRLALYSGDQDGPVLMLLGAFGLLSNSSFTTLPPFGSSLVIESYVLQPNDTYAVRVLYNNQDVTAGVDGCGGPTLGYNLCSMDAFLTTLSNLVPSISDCNPSQSDGTPPHRRR